MLQWQKSVKGEGVGEAAEREKGVLEKVVEEPGRVKEAVVGGK